MGRKPNPLILEFFIRGAKLEDSSNRYEHTCKSCGEKFPKGRIDSLTAHLVKKCPAISLRDRQKALLQLNDLPIDFPDARNQQNQQVELAGNRNWTALETLAEVSRQIDLSEKHDDRTVPNTNAGPERQQEPQRTDRFELQEQWTQDNPPLSYEARVQRDKKMLGQKTDARNDDEVTLQSFDRPTSPSETIAMAAAAQARFAPMLDPALMNEGLPELPRSDVADAEQAIDHITQYLAHRPNEKPQDPTWPMLDGTPGNLYPSQEELQQGHVHTFPSVPPPQGMITEFSAEFGNGQRPNKPKVRGRFTDNRRKEVQEVRKRGACIRCRMLKKPCSGETPCATCKNVESARLWKQPCIRTRIAEELDMWSAGLHAVLAYHEVNAVKARLNFEPAAQNIDVSHYPETSVFATFKALVGHETQPQENIDPSLDLGNEYQNQSTIYRVLDNEHDDHPAKMEAYIKRMSSTFYEKEGSHFMNVTLAVAQELATRSQDQLLTRVLELWSTIHILVDHEVSWVLFEKSEHNPEAPGTTIEEVQNYQVICMQLNAAAEKKAAIISKSVLNDLERRLLLRTANQSFETFLVSIILLNCVEKSTWLFKSWEQDFLKARWPLDKTPVWYGAQGDHITDLLQMLLRMRNIPPKTFIAPETGIVTTEVEAAKEYFDKLQLNNAELVDKQQNPTFDPADSRCYELRFCSKLLLPMT